MLLPKLLGGDLLDVLQVLARPGRGNQLDADRRAVGNPERNEQKGFRRREVSQVGQVLAGFVADVRAADFPAPAVVAGLEAQPLHDFPCGLGRISVANVDGEAVEVVAVDRVHHGTHHAVGAFTGIAFGQHLGTHGVWAIADYGEIAGDDAGC